MMPCLLTQAGHFVALWLESGTVDPGVTPWHETRGVDESVIVWRKTRTVDDSTDGGWHDIERASYRAGVKGLESKDWVVWLVWWVYACQTKVL